MTNKSQDILSKQTGGPVICGPDAMYHPATPYLSSCTYTYTHHHHLKYAQANRHDYVFEQPNVLLNPNSFVVLLTTGMG